MAVQQESQNTPPADRGGASRRRIRNFVLDPYLQFPVGIIAVLLSIVLGLTLVSLIYLQIGDTITLIAELTDVPSEAMEMLRSAAQETLWLVAGVVLIYVATMMAVSVILTHKLIGPTIAFRRHIGLLVQGQYGARTNLRKGDAFTDLASGLNQLSEVLENRARGGEQGQRGPH